MRQTLQNSRPPSNSRGTSRIKRRRRGESSEITITPLRGFFIALLFLGIPTVSLGSLCLSLLQNNLRLSETNSELTEIANEVKAEVDSLGEEIESLQARAGTSKVASRSTAKSSTAKSPETSDSKAEFQNDTDAPGESGTALGQRPQSGLANGLTSGERLLEKAMPPRGGPANQIDALDLLKDAQQQVPVLNRALDATVKPAIEEALAQEAAYPDGQPVVGVVEVSSEFGIRSNPFGGGGYEMHEGIDFAGDYGDIIAAAGDGKVVLAGYNGGYGMTVTIDHGNGYETLYAHLSELKVEEGETVKRGQIIGYMGSTGRSTGPHLHYGILEDKKAINPRQLLKLQENNMALGPR